MAKVRFTTKKGAQKIVIGPADELQGRAGAVDARAFVDESPVPKASKDDFGPIDRQLDALHDPQREKLYFYCDAGLFRSGTMAALYMVKHLGYTSEEAIEEMDTEFSRVYGSWGDQVKIRVKTWLQAFEQLVMGRPQPKRTRPPSGTYSRK